MGLLGWAAALLPALRVPRLKRGVVAWLGERRFGIGMVHLPIVRAVETVAMPHAHGSAGLWIGQGASLAVTLVAATPADRLSAAFA